MKLTAICPHIPGCWIALLFMSSSHAAVNIDGSRVPASETEYTSRTVQTIVTNWGAGNALANLHTAQTGNDLNVFIGGRATDNAIILFIDSKAGGSSLIRNNLITSGGEENTINNLGSSNTAGLTFEDGFNPDYAIRIYGDSAGTGAFVNSYDLQAGTRSYVGESVTATAGSGFVSAIRTVWADVGPPLSSVTNGVEMKLSRAALGVASGTQTVKFMAILVNGNSTYGSNQVLASRTTTTDMGSGVNSINFQTESGIQTLAFDVTGPPPRNVIFSVNMNDEITRGHYTPGSGTVKVLFFSGIASPSPGQLVLTDPNTDGIYTGSLDVVGDEGAAFGEYKFFNTQSGAPNFGYEYGANRNFNLGPANTTQTLNTVIFRPNSFALWAGNNASGQSSTQDYDHDGMANGVEYFMGQTGSTYTSNPQLVNGLISWPHDANAVGVSYKVRASENLVDWSDVSGSAVDSGGFLSFTLPTNLPRQFVRLEITVP